MPRVEADDIDVKRCLKYCMAERKKGKLKYFTILKMKEKDVEKYHAWLTECDTMGFDFCLAFVKPKNDNENKYYVCGFSNFELRHDMDTEVLNVTFYENTQDIIGEYYFGLISKNAAFFLISGMYYIQRLVYERVVKEKREPSIIENMERRGVLKFVPPNQRDKTLDFGFYPDLYDDED